MRYLLLLAIALAGCFQSGRDFNFADTARLTPGVSTIADAEAIFGIQTSVYVGALGQTNLVWAYGHAVMYGPHGAKSLALAFDAHGRYTGVRSQSTFGSDVPEAVPTSAPKPAASEDTSGSGLP